MAFVLPSLHSLKHHQRRTFVGNKIRPARHRAQTCAQYITSYWRISNLHAIANFAVPCAACRQLPDLMVTMGEDMPCGRRHQACLVSPIRYGQLQ